MQSLYLLGTRQISSLNQDLAQLESSQNVPPPAAASGTLRDSNASNGDVDRAALLGQCVASLQAFQRTIDDYEGMARRELVKEKQEKAEARISKFRDDYGNLRKHLDRLKQSHAAEGSMTDRNALLRGSSSSSSAASAWTPSSLSARRPITHTQPPAESPFTLSRTATPHEPQKAHGQRTQAALDENSFLQSTSAALDSYIAQGQAVLQNLGSQRDVMKDAQRRLLSVANTLGMSRSTITFIERRSKGDMYVLLFGATGTLFCFWYILRLFG